MLAFRELEAYHLMYVRLLVAGLEQHGMRVVIDWILSCRLAEQKTNPTAPVTVIPCWMVMTFISY